jgi:hypothetical protein
VLLALLPVALVALAAAKHVHAIALHSGSTPPSQQATYMLPRWAGPQLLIARSCMHLSTVLSTQSC